MLESYFAYPAVLARMRRGPLAAEIDDIAADLQRTGYARLTVVRYLSLTASFSRYAEDQGCAKPDRIDRALTERFLDEMPASWSTWSLARTALGHVLKHLEGRYPGPAEPAPPADPDDQLLAAFDAHMRDRRGLQPRTREEVLRVARRMLTWCRDRRPRRSLSQLTGADVLTFVSALAAEDIASSTRSAWMSCVRGLLRYLRWTGLLQVDLACNVPRTPFWRLAQVPSRLAWADVQRTIDSIDPADPIGKRDRALLLLLATTGLRNQEVRLLELHDVRWRTSELHLRRTKSQRERVIPLGEQAGRALADYVLHGRPRSTSRMVFLLHRGPVGPMRSSGTLSAIVRQRLERCGIRPPRAGAHLFRHSLATHLVQQERPIKEIADLLGHRSIDTTAIYVKVALPQLLAVALPFPGDGA